MIYIKQFNHFPPFFKPFLEFLFKKLKISDRSRRKNKQNKLTSPCFTVCLGVSVNSWHLINQTQLKVLKMAFNLRTFQEPRGVMRIIQFIFAICAFATTSGYTNTLTLWFCENDPKTTTVDFDYPFKLSYVKESLKCNASVTSEFSLIGDFSSDSQFFVATGVLSFLYTIGISAVYALLDDVYQSNPFVPMADFILTVLLAVFWLSGSAAWSNGLAGLKSMTDPNWIRTTDACRAVTCTHVTVGSFSTLNVSVIFGFLNFFLWASDLWFLYKETQWFKNANPAAPTSPGALA